MELEGTKIEVINFKEYKTTPPNDDDEYDLLVFYCGENLYNSLDIFLKFLHETKDNNYMYKWAILAIHSALVEFMLSAIRGNNWRNVTKESKNKESKVISTMSLYYMIEEEYFPNNKDNNIRRQFVERLNNLRNEFSHPYYDLNFIDKVLLIKLFKNAIDIIEILVNNSSNVKKMLKDAENNDINNIIDKIKNTMKKMR